MYFRIAQILTLSCLMLGLAVGCGTHSKGNNAKDPGGDSGNELLEVEPVQLKLATPNEITVNAGGHQKVQAQFLFNSEDNYKLRVTSLSHELEAQSFH